ncbi:serine/threonine-protein kinase EDR1 isoform X2 [Amborella trichopoda]|uniref:serine/threonine-protein kinase EDR1 isoform X2 n=1 Tax=Amborella trichopoda TaxID=13333 RepID=UPI0009BDA487|nr:serine/threonine-protein kinase EDR1 isoform X2 [Amborella trichopoda]|eukprot:XP_020531419.1 serine/threonine-protein kinase EDR1 isoform X2 [Amborella trichopoda]
MPPLTRNNSDQMADLPQESRQYQMKNRFPARGSGFPASTHDPGHYQELQKRLWELERSHYELKEQFQSLKAARDSPENGDRRFSSGWRRLDSGERGGSVLPGFYSRNPYSNILQSMGHALYICRASTGEIVYWNRAAENLYGWMDCEAIGQRATELLIDERHYGYVERIMERLSMGHSWSGQFPFKKRSGEVFTAIVTETPLYEDGEITGVITVSTDAAPFNSLNPQNLGPNNQSREQVDRVPRIRGLSKAKIQWHPSPQIASSVSNLASKVLSRLRAGDANDSDCSSESGHESMPDTEHRESRGSDGLVGNSSGSANNNQQNEEDGNDSSQPLKIVGKVLSKLQIGVTSNNCSQLNRTGEPYPLDNLASISMGKPAESLSKVTPGDSNPGSNDSAKASPKDPMRLIGSKLVPKILPILKLKRTPGSDHSSADCKERGCIQGGDNSNGVNNKKLSPTLMGCPECSDIDKLGFPSPPLASEQEGKEHAQPSHKGSDENLVGDVGAHHKKLDRSSSGDSTGGGSRGSSSRGEMEQNAFADCEIIWEDLILREEIGQGSYAVVHHGIWNGSDVAIKVYSGGEYHEGILLDYKKEIDIMKRLRHPNVLLFMGAVYAPNRLAIVTEFMPRGSLFRTLHKNTQALDLKRRLRMALDVARGMNYLHHRNPPIIHRDLKSSNLLVDKNWTVKVGDFGLSRLKNSTFVTAKSGRGTPQWMAPEVLRNEPSNEKSDVYSFGVILWELMTESVPWSNLNSLQVVGVVGFMDRRLELPEGLDHRVSSIIQDCWHSDPECRPSFEHIPQRLRSLINTVPATAVRRTSSSETPSCRRKGEIFTRGD